MGISPNVALRIIALAMIGLAGCDVPDSSPTGPATPGRAEPIEVQGASVQTGDTVHVNVRLYRATPTGNEMIDGSRYSYTSTRPAIVTMLSLGYAVAMGVGTADVIVSAPGAADVRFPVEVIAAAASEKPANESTDRDTQGSDPSAPAESPGSADESGDASAGGAAPAEPAGVPGGAGAEKPEPHGGPASPPVNGDDDAPDPGAGSTNPDSGNTDPSGPGAETDPANSTGGTSDPGPPAPADPAPPVEADVEVHPGDDLVALVNGAARGAVIYLHGHPDGRGHTYEIGQRVLTVPDNATLRGPTARRGPNGEIDAPVKIRGSGRQIFDQNLRTGWTIEHLDISGARFVSDRNQDGVGVTRGSGTLRYVKIHDNDNKGLGGWSGLLEYSELTNNSAAQISGHSAASKSIHVHAIRHTFVHHNHYYGVWTDCDNRGWVVEDNTITDNFGSGIFNEISRGPTLIARNRVARNNLGEVQGRAGIVVSSSRNVRITGNTIMDNGVVDVRIWNDRRAGNGANACQSGYRIENVLVTPDNVIGSTW